GNMIMSMIVTCREFFEMFLILVPLAVYLYKINQKKLLKNICTGGAVGLAATLLTGIAAYNTTAKLEGYAENLFMGSTMLFLSGLILFSLVIIKKHSKGVQVYDQTIENNFTAYSLFTLAFVTTFRESLEILLFFLPFMHISLLSTLSGGVIGFAISLVGAFLIFKFAAKLNINIVFTVLNLFLIYIGASLFGESLLELFPSVGGSIELAGQLIYGIPAAFLFIKSELRKYIKS
ncbi:MAG: high-affinity Fe2+/Pb2+ permease, partial [Clostridiaceae bacterium]|nr:high-affinity Fe2+/Pb2+ permease [Clostridiaceae bacterium]